jgi:hypothetical protein
MKLDFNIKLGKWALFSILIIVILYGSYYSLFGFREGFEPGTCPSGCWGPPQGKSVDGNCKRYNVEDGYNTFYVTIGSTSKLNITIPANVYTGVLLGKKMQELIRNISNQSTKKFTCTYHNPGLVTKDPYINQMEFNLNNDASDNTSVTISFVIDKKPYPDKTSLGSLFKTNKIVLKGNTPQYTKNGLNLTNPYFPSSLVPTSNCPKICAWGGYEGGITKDKDYCQYDKDCKACATVNCPKGVCPDPGPKPTPPPSTSKEGGKGGKGKGGNGGKGKGVGDDNGGDDKPDCSQAKCYAQPLAGTNDQFNQFDPYHPNDPHNPNYDEDDGFCGIDYTAKDGMKFMFGCNTTESCTTKKLNCNTVCKRNKDGKIIDTANCQEYPCTKGVNWNKKDCVVKNPGNIDTDSIGKGNNSSNNYYDADMDDYMNELMKPGQMTPNQMYNFRQARYGCDASQYGCCADGFTYRKDASGNNCFDFLPYYNPILFRGGA